MTITILLSVLFLGCESEGKDIDKDLQDDLVFKVPIHISVGRGWTIGLGDDSEGVTRGVGTRSVPYDHDELIGVMEAQIYTFRRPMESNADEPFRYDPTNYMVLPLSASGLENDLVSLKGEGSLVIRSEFEYKVIALSYSTNRKSSYSSIFYSQNIPFGLRDATSDLNRFYPVVEPDMSLDDFKMRIKSYEIKFEEGYWVDYLNGKNSDFSANDALLPHLQNTDILNWYATEMPHLFYGECYIDKNGVKDNVFSCADIISPLPNDERDGSTVNDSQEIARFIQGTLHGGMAKVVINIQNCRGHYVSNVGNGLVNWIALISDNVKDECHVKSLWNQDLGDTQIIYDRYTCVGFAKKEKDATAVQLTAYLWPCVTHLGLRVRFDKNLEDVWLYLGNYQLCPEDNSSVDPISHEEIINTKDNVFFLRPNHKYEIDIEDPEAALYIHELK